LITAVRDSGRGAEFVEGEMKNEIIALIMASAEIVCSGLWESRL
jgi:hypothetical protein